MQKPDNCPTITALICTLNEAENLPYVLPKIPEWVDEVLLVDGHSADATVEVAKSLCHRIRVLYQPGKGKGDAIKQGVNKSIGDIVVTIDADGQTDPEDIAKFIKPLLDGYDVAKGTRLNHGRPQNMTRFRWFGNKILSMTSNLLYGTNYSDICSGYNAFWKKAFQRLKLTKNGFEMEQEMLMEAKKAGLRIVEVEHQYIGRIGNTSKVSAIKQGFIDWMQIIRGRFRD